jgi:hypothetical protein
MSRIARCCMTGTIAVLLAVAAAGSADTAPQADRTPPTREPSRRPPPERQAQPRTPAPRDRDAPRPPATAPRQRPVVVRGEVFVGGYFYDPVFGPYPWWPRWHYPYWYAPVFDQRATLRVKATPDDAAVYVDGFYAGVVDDFDGVFQGLPLTPGGHVVLLYRPGLVTERHNLYLRPASTFTLRTALAPLRPGERSELPPAAIRVPAPPRPGSYRVPVPRWPESDATAGRVDEATVGWLELEVHPSRATVTIDGEPWSTTDPGRFRVDLPDGRHRVRVAAPGFTAADVEVAVVRGQTQALVVNLVPAT